MTKPVLWTEEMDRRLAGMKRAGVRAEDIAKRLGVGLSTMQRRARELKTYARLDHKGCRRVATSSDLINFARMCSPEEGDEVLKGAPQ